MSALQISEHLKLSLSQMIPDQDAFDNNNAPLKVDMRTWAPRKVRVPRVPRVLSYNSSILITTLLMPGK